MSVRFGLHRLFVLWPHSLGSDSTTHDDRRASSQDRARATHCSDSCDECAHACGHWPTATSDGASGFARAHVCDDDVSGQTLMRRNRSALVPLASHTHAPANRSALSNAASMDATSTALRRALRLFAARPPACLFVCLSDMCHALASRRLCVSL